MRAFEASGPLHLYSICFCDAFLFTQRAKTPHAQTLEAADLTSHQGASEAYQYRLLYTPLLCFTWACFSPRCTILWCEAILHEHVMQLKRERFSVQLLNVQNFCILRMLLLI